MLLRKIVLSSSIVFYLCKNNQPVSDYTEVKSFFRWELLLSLCLVYYSHITNLHVF